MAKLATLAGEVLLLSEIPHRGAILIPKLLVSSGVVRPDLQSAVPSLI